MPGVRMSYSRTELFKIIINMLKDNGLDDDEAWSWMFAENPSFGYRSPIELIRFNPNDHIDGGKLVLDHLIMLAQGNIGS
jgi:uncharacterized protein (DUF2384 family)